MATSKHIKLQPGKNMVGQRFWPTLSSLLISLGFINSHLGSLVLVGLLPFIYYFVNSKNLSTKQILFDCWLAAFVAALFAGGWTLQVTPATWIDLNGGTSVAVKVVMWLMISLCAALTFGLVTGLFISNANKRSSTVLITLPVVWAFAELVRSYSLAVFFVGPGSSMSPNWNFGALGLATASTPLAYLSRFIGLYGLSMVAVAVNIAIFMLISRRYKTALSIITIIMLLNLLAWRLYMPDTSRSINVASVYLHDAGGSLKVWKDVRLPAKDTSIIVLPEYSHFFENRDFHKFVISKFGSKSIIISSQDSRGRPPTNNLTFYSNNTGFISSQPKTFLAPYGEYMPYAAVGLLKTLGQQAALDNFRKNSQIRKGELPEHVVRVNGINIGGLACSGVLSLNEYRNLAHQGANVLTNSASLSLLSTSSLYRIEALYQNRFQAISNAKPFVQASRAGPAYIISSDGKILAQSGDRSALIETHVQLQPKRTVLSWLP